jgi:hypothetical protein
MMPTHPTSGLTHMAAASQGVARVQLIWIADANIHPEILGRRRDSGRRVRNGFTSPSEWNNMTFARRDHGLGEYDEQPQMLRPAMFAAMLLLPLATVSANAAGEGGDTIDRVEAKRTGPFEGGLAAPRSGDITIL